ncbi:MAG TPA: cation-transporting P-type ATPase [Pyrinomonadaceae bacterium]|jgi:Ca2+-transporting ATPase
MDSLTASTERAKPAGPTERSSGTVETAHALSLEEVEGALAVRAEDGLSSTEAAERRATCGANELQSVRERAAWRILLDQFASLVIALLAFAALVAWVTKDRLEALAILVALLINALIGFFTEWQAGRALDALRRQARASARVRRDAYERVIDAGELVPGDVVLLSAGDHVPADARIVEAYNLQVEESALTGESAPLAKGPGPVSQDAPLAERTSMLYVGTAVTMGHAVAIVTATGMRTELGKIGRLVATSVKEASPLERRLAELGRRLVYLVLLIAVVVILTGYLRGDDFWMMVEVGISLAVAAVPEGLPAATTLILALGLLRMARQQAIIRRLGAVETLGSTTVICTDKTGTLTENRMTVREYRLSDGRTVEVDDWQSSLADDPLLMRAVRVGVLCNEASFHAGPSDETSAVGDPTETALLVVADALVLDVQQERASHPKLTEQPFHAQTKRMTTLHRRRDGKHFAALKGAPAVVLEACSSYVDGEGCARPLDGERRASLLAANERMAERALRVLALADKHFGEEAEGLSDADLEDEYTFLGFVGMIDPPRPGVAEAIERAHCAGIRTVMLTGDQLHTARAIARELGLGDALEPRVLHARDLVGADEARLAELARVTDVFARVSPEDKLHVVEALKKAGEVVAVTGDGVNDAPALKRANVGVAMGLRGSEVAKEAADVVLADDNFATIVRAIEGGRTIYANIVKFVHLMFSKNLAEVLVIFTAIAVGWPLPLLPLQILWMNLVTDIFPAMALAVEPASPEIMRQRPRSPQRALLSSSFLMLIGWQAVMLAALALGAYVWALRSYGAGAHSRTVALLALVGVQLGHMFNCRSRTRSFVDHLFSNPFIWIAALMLLALQLLALYFPPLALVLNTSRPTRADWLVLCACTLAPVMIVEVVKIYFRRQGEGAGVE